MCVPYGGGPRVIPSTGGLRGAHGPLPIIRVLPDCGARMRAPCGTSPLVVPVPEKMQVKVRKAGTRK